MRPKLRVSVAMAFGLASAGVLSMVATSTAAQQGIGTQIKDSFRNSTLATKVGVRLQYNKALLTEKIEVEADDGVVILSGNLSTKDKIDLAVELARGIDGVKMVDNRLKVGPPIGSDPFKSSN